VSKPKPQIAGGRTSPARASPEDLAQCNLGLVIEIARNIKRRLPSTLEFDELVGAGNLGLVEAACRFDPAKGTSFKTFATPRIRGAIIDSLRRVDPVSRSLRSHQKTLERVNAELMLLLGRHPTEAETAKRFHVSLRRWRKLRRELYEAGCIVNSDPVNGAGIPADPDALPGGWADPEQLADLAETRQILLWAMGMLPHRYQYVLQLYHFEERTIKQIGIRLGVDESRVSQIRAAALAKLQVQLAPVFRKSE
jgi:RNA polymerase sigma factor FliA